MKTLVVVESSSKIPKLKKILDNDFVIKGSSGSFMNLKENCMSIDFDNNFEPFYVITKPDIVKTLRESMKGVAMLYIAADRDIEGESIAQHIYDVLQPKKYKRLIFNSITKSVIDNAIKNAGKICVNTVNAQKARRVVDRLYGYTLSTVVQKNAGGVSAGRVQSVIVKIIIDRENKITKFFENNSESTYFIVTGTFSSYKSTLYTTEDPDQEHAYSGEIAHIPLGQTTDNPNKYAIRILTKCSISKFVVHDSSEKIVIRNPPPPYETCTLQQDASTKLNSNSTKTMATAQSLYSSGYITYIRTDSVEISDEGHENIKKTIIATFGEKYYTKKQYKNKSTSSQEAHEAIRPTDCSLHSLKDEISCPDQIKLYDLIWKRTMASQMKPAKICVSTIQINISEYTKHDPLPSPFYYFQSSSERILFDGYLIIYNDLSEEEIEKASDKNVNGIEIDDILIMSEITAKQDFKKPPLRYNEPTLTSTLKSIGICRPSTYAPSLLSIVKRGYVKIDNIPGVQKEISVLQITKKNPTIVTKISKITIGKENRKFVPTPMGIRVTDFLSTHFAEIMDIKFTAKMESELTEIINGKKIWHKVVRTIYTTLLDRLDEFNKTNKDTPSPVKINITIGTLNKKPILIKEGTYGQYISFDDKNYSIPKTTPQPITEDSAIELINEKINSTISTHSFQSNKKKINATIMKGKYGPYIRLSTGKSYPIPKNIDISAITIKQIKEICSVK